MNCETLKKRLADINYSEVADAVELRYVLLKALLYSATEYNNAPHLRLFQQHAQLEKIHASLKQEIRNGNINGRHFMQAKQATLTCLDNIAMQLQALPVAA